jgi:hypothetical protein
MSAARGKATVGGRARVRRKAREDEDDVERDGGKRPNTSDTRYNGKIQTETNINVCRSTLRNDATEKEREGRRRRPDMT